MLPILFQRSLVQFGYCLWGLDFFLDLNMNPTLRLLHALAQEKVEGLFSFEGIQGGTMNASGGSTKWGIGSMCGAGRGHHRTRGGQR